MTASRLHLGCIVAAFSLLPRSAIASAEAPTLIKQIETAYADNGQVASKTVKLIDGSDASSWQSSTTQYFYDAAGRLTRVSDPLGHTIDSLHDDHGRLSSRLDMLGNQTILSYDQADNVSTRVENDALPDGTHESGRQTSYVYDSQKRLQKTVFPELLNGQPTVETYTYTPDGLLASKTDRKGQTIAYTYGSLKRLLTKTYPNSTAITYSYTGQSLTEVYDTSTSPAEIHTFQYDPSYRVATNVQGPRGTLTYQYNPDDTVLDFSVQGGPTTSYTDYPDGSLDTIAWTPVSGNFKYAYTPNGQYQTITFPNGQTRNYTYDDQGRLLELANLHPTAGNLATYSYGYDVNNATGQYTMLGQRVSMTADVPSQAFAGAMTNYTYDIDYQLTGTAYPSASPFNGEVDGWTYDAIGNRLTANGQPYTYLKNGANPNNGQRLSTDGTNTYAYDANENTTSRTGPQSYAFGWDIENRMSVISGGIAASYAYDSQGRRSAKTVGSTISYLYNGMNLLSEIGKADYVFGPGIDEPLGVAKNGTVSYFDADALGSVAATNDSGGAIQHGAVFDVWGATRHEFGTRFHPFAYTAREIGDAGDLYYRARFYSPGTGRFDSEDPLIDAARQAYMLSRISQPVLFPAYEYARNVPARFTDPLGMDAGGSNQGPVNCVGNCQDTLNRDLFKCLRSFTYAEMGCTALFAGCTLGSGGTATPACVIGYAACQMWAHLNYQTCAFDASSGYFRCLKNCNCPTP